MDAIHVKAFVLSPWFSNWGPGASSSNIPMHLVKCAGSGLHPGLGGQKLGVGGWPAPSESQALQVTPVWVELGNCCSGDEITVDFYFLLFSPVNHIIFALSIKLSIITASLFKGCNVIYLGWNGWVVQLKYRHILCRRAKFLKIINCMSHKSALRSWKFYQSPYNVLHMHRPVGGA